MTIALIDRTKNTRGVNSRTISYKAIGKWVAKPVERESKPVLNPDGSKKIDAEGNEVRESLGKTPDGKLITITEMVNEFVTEGVLDANGSGMADALELVNGDEQILLDCFAEGWNERSYAKEADKDELDEFLSTMTLDKEQQSQFKRTARQISRNYDVELLEAAEMVKKLMLKKLAKVEATATA